MNWSQTDQQIHALTMVGGTRREIESVLGRMMNEHELTIMHRARLVRKMRGRTGKLKPPDIDANGMFDIDTKGLI